MSNEITAYFKGRAGIAESVYQNDYGIVLIFDGIELPTYFNCYFDTGGSDEEISGLGYDNRVVIPNSILARPGKVLVHIPYTDTNKSRVEYVAGFNVIGRARPADYGTPAQMTAIEQALAMLQTPITNIEDIVNAALAFTGPALADLESDNEDNKTAISTLTSRMDSFTRLAEGSTTGDAELIDGRTGANGTTYSDIGTAIRTQITNVLNLIAKTPTLVPSAAEQIPNETDYNSLLTSGSYIVLSATAAQTMVHCPTTSAHRLFVLEVIANRIIQIVQVNNSATDIIMRFYNGTTWYDWHRIVFANDPSSIISAEQNGLTNMPLNTNYNSLTTVGGYEVRASAAAKKMQNCPTQLAHRLYVTKLYTGSTKTYQIIIGSDDKMTQYVRYLDNKGNWSAWSSSATDPTAKYTPLYNEYNNVFSLNVSRIKHGGMAVYSTLPYETAVKGTEDCYNLGDAIDAVVYSSVWRDGLDVYRNLTLETFYSALANPASVLYTKNYTGINIYNAHSWYGGVCSTYVTKILGLRQYKTTAQLEDYIEPKQIVDYHDVEVGDALLMTGHIAFISQIYTDSDGALAGFGISEQTGRMFRTTIIDANDFASYIKRRGYTVMQLKEPLPPVTLDDPRFNSEIIFERGNNTYITEDDISEGAWFYIPNADTIYYKKDDGEFTSVDVSSLTTDTVNEVTVYDLSDCFDGVGDYIFTDDTDAVKMCLIKVIDVGNISLSGNTLTLSGWENCVPYNYYIVRETARTSDEQGYAMNPSEGYVCVYTNKCGGIDVEAGETSKTVEIPAADLAGYNRYKLWLEYDTGIGYKQAFSNLVIL